MSNAAESECNSAFVFLKPHTSSSDRAAPFVENFLSYRNLIIAKKGVLTISKPLWENLIDKTYPEACQRALVSKPASCPTTEQQKSAFFFHFGENWDECVENKIVLNAVDACSYLEVSHKELVDLWIQNSREQSKYAELSRWMKCCCIDTVQGKRPIYCVNGFYLGLRGLFSSSAVSVPFFVVEWKLGQYTWEQFSEKIIGEESPERSGATTLRGAMYRDWETIGIESPPSAVDDCVHASESAFAALVEKKNWIPQWDVRRDYFFVQLRKSGIGQSQLEKLELNPVLRKEKTYVYNMLRNHDAVSSLPILRGLVNDHAADLLYEYPR